MKLTKGMKKALSLLLSAAMVVTGVNVTTNTAKAADGEKLATWTGKLQAVAVGNNTGDTDEAAQTELDGLTGDNKLLKAWNSWGATGTASWDCGANVTFTFSTTNGAVRSVKVYGTSPSELTDGVEVSNGHDSGTLEDWGDPHYDIAKSKKFKAPEGNFVATFVLAANEEYVCVAPKAKSTLTITKVEIYEGTLEGDGTIEAVTTETSAPTGSASGNATNAPASGNATNAPASGNATNAPGNATNAPGETNGPGETGAPSVPEGMVSVADMPEKGSMSEFCIYVANFADTSWGNGGSAGVNDNALVIKENGTYELTVTPEADGDGIQVFYLATNLYNGSTTKDFKLTLDKLKNGEKEYKVDNTKGGYMLFADTDADKEMRVNIVNPWNALASGDDLQTDVEGTEGVNAFGEVVEVKEGQKITVTFKVEGMDKDGELYTYPKVQKGDDAQATPTAPATSTKPTAPATSGVVTNGTVSTAAVGTEKIKPAKKSVVVAPNKSVKVSFTKTLATSVTQSAVVTAAIASKKVVASAKVTDTSAKKGTVTIKAAKKAVKGSSTTVTLKSTNKDGKAVSAKITVKIQNKVKKVKAAKKSVVIKKKGKTAKLVLKVTAENKKKATTDTVSIKGAGKKVVTIKSAKAAKGKITLTLKGKKKGSKKVAFKVGKKTVNVKVTVKK